MAPSFDGEFDYSSHCHSLCCCAELTEPWINRFFRSTGGSEHTTSGIEEERGTARTGRSRKLRRRCDRHADAEKVSLGNPNCFGFISRPSVAVVLGPPFAEFANSVCWSLSFAGAMIKFKAVQNARFKESPQTFSSSSSSWCWLM